MKYKWASIDLDHTLLERGRIKDSSYKAIKEYQNLGGSIFLCTGRWIISAIEFNKKIEKYTNRKNNFIISLNGALIYDLIDKKVIYANCIPDEILKKILIIRDEIKVAFWLYSMRGIINKKIYVVKLPLRKIVEKFNYGKILKLNSNNYVYKGDTLKILLLSFSKKKIDNIFNKLNNEFKDILSFSRTSKKSIEITNINCNKGTGINFISKYYNIDKNNIVAFGDSNNDVTMFKEVGLRIGIDPSSLKLIELSDFIQKGNNAFANAMWDYVIKK